MDTSKSVFVLHGVDAGERPVLRKTLRRRQVIEFFARLPPTHVGMEACGAAHHWARELEALGHEVKLLPAQRVKPYVARNKNDRADAEAICEAMSRPRMTFVPVKTAEQQAALMLAGMRDQLVARRTQLTNTIRGYAAEFGLVAAKGLDKIEPLLARTAADESLPILARELFAALGAEYAELKPKLRKIEAQLLAWHRQNELSRRLAEIPGVGPIGAALMVMKVANPRAFRSGRDFAAWLGLTPKDHSTAGKLRLGVITRAGDEANATAAHAPLTLRMAVLAPRALRPNPASFAPCSPSSRRGLSALQRAAPRVRQRAAPRARRPALTAAVRGASARSRSGRRNGPQSNKETRAMGMSNPT
jgi:transposase